MELPPFCGFSYLGAVFLGSRETGFMFWSCLSDGFVLECFVGLLLVVVFAVCLICGVDTSVGGFSDLADFGVGTFRV